MAHIFAFEEIAEVVRLPSAQRTLDLLTLKVPQLVGLMKFANPEQNLTSILCPNLTECLHDTTAHRINHSLRVSALHTKVCSVLRNLLPNLRITKEIQLLRANLKTIK
jgi:hypothetical protein